MVLSIVHSSYNIFNSYLKKAAEVSLEESKKLHEFRIGRFANLQKSRRLTNTSARIQVCVIGEYNVS